MSTWTLADIRQKVRQVTGRFTENEMTTTQLDDYINKYYTLTFPAEVKLEQKHVYYSFTTSENQAYYDQPETTFTNFEPPATVNNLQLLWYQNPNDFFQENTLQYTFLTPWTGDGTTTNFTTTVTGFPIYPGTLTIYDGVELFQDSNEDWTDQDVTLTGDQGGTATINYNEGTVDVTFATAPVNGENINLNYVIFQPGRPRAILMYNNQFQLFPVPDQAYIIEMKAYSIVADLTSATQTPDLSEWGPMIAYGTARDIFSDYGELDAYAETTALYKEQKNYVLTRTCQDLLNTRSTPNF